MNSLLPFSVKSKSVAYYRPHFFLLGACLYLKTLRPCLAPADYFYLG